MPIFVAALNHFQQSREISRQIAQDCLKMHKIAQY